jgi:Spy/CpxP family protein refolding chaperone
LGVKNCKSPGFLAWRAGERRLSDRRIDQDSEVRMSFSSTVRSFVSLTALSGALALAACSSQSPNANAPASAVADPQGATAAGETREHNPLLAGAWKLPDLTADQEVKLKSIEDDLHAASAPRRAAQKELAEIFATGLEKGALDEAAANAKIDQIAQLADAEKAKTGDSLDALHAMLTPAQRAEVVELTKAAWKEHKEGFKHHEGGGFGMHMKQLAEDLKLTDDQKQAFKDEFEKMPHPDKSQFEGMKAKMKAVGDAFASDTFDAKALGVGDKGATMAKNFATRMERMVEASIKILDANQRTLLAAKIRERAAKMAG